MKVKLAASSFTPAELQELQPVADHVAQLVDELIPGKPEDYPANGIVVFEAPIRWKSPTYAIDYSAPPVTINGLRVYDEPSETANNAVRIALNELPQPNYLSLSYQLAHELAHVKMGVRTDNYLDETFAVALSLEVLRRLGYEGYMLSCEGKELLAMPLPPQAAIALDLTRHNFGIYGAMVSRYTIYSQLLLALLYMAAMNLGIDRLLPRVQRRFALGSFAALALLFCGLSDRFEARALHRRTQLIRDHYAAWTLAPAQVSLVPDEDPNLKTPSMIEFRKRAVVALRRSVELGIYQPPWCDATVRPATPSAAE